MSIKIQTMLTYNWEEQQYEENDQPSLTVPDQTMSIREIIDRYANGGVIETFTPFYGDEEDFDEILPDPFKMDLAERQALTEQFQEELQSYSSTPLEVPLPKEENNETALEGQ
jgi:hypothetical protein